MKTTIDIPPDLLKEVMRITKAKSKRDAVIGAMEELTRREKIDRVLSYFGTFKDFMTQEELMDMRLERGKYAPKRK